MLRELARKWWVLLLNGICAIAFGLMAFAWPGITLLALVVLFGAYALIDGITAVAASIAGRNEAGRSWWQMLLVGILGILAGITAFIWPGITTVALLVVIAVWAIVRGIMEIIAAIELRKVIQDEWLLGLAGVASVLFGITLIGRPAVGALAVVWLIGGFAIAHGILLAALAFRVRGFKDRLESPHARFA
jgi:uncharacterized membrane protein HdeD (DUF308 family)